MDKITAEQLLEQIYAASKEEINPILNAVSERFCELWPEWELITLSVQGHDRENHIKVLQDSLAVLSEKNDLPSGRSFY